MTKEEKIKEAWGEYYDGVKQYLSDSGFPEVNRYSRNYIDKNISKVNQERIAEKLIIINHNNGWIKIESEDDLPTDTEVKYWGANQNGVFEDIIFPFESISIKYKNKTLTHYQPIQELKPPLY